MDPRKTKKSSLLLLAALLTAAISTSCMLRMLQPAPKAEVVEKKQLASRVAILPFVNKTSNPQAAILVRKMFYNFFSSLNYHDMEPFIIDASLKRNGLYNQIVAGDSISAARLGQLLGVDAVVFGEVTSLGKTYALVYSDTCAGLKAQMVRCKSRRVIWKMENTVHLEEGDVPLTPLGLAATVLRTAVSHQQATLLKAAAQLCMQMVATIPNPKAVTVPPPKIQALVHNGAGKLLRPGDYLKLAMIGDKNQLASWSMPPLVQNLPMREQKPGIYIGAYRIKPGDRLAGGRLIGYLRSGNNAVASQWMDTLGPVKVGDPTLLPRVIAKDYVLQAEKSPYLVTEALVVQPGARLTIGAGTVIWFRSLGLIVKGELQILGTRNAPVQLAGLGSSGWKGIFLEGSRSQNKMRFCTVSDARFGLRALKANVAIEKCRFQNNVWAIVLEETNADIATSLIRTCKRTGISARRTSLRINSSVVTENKAGGILLEDSRVKMAHNNIVNNGGWQIKVLGSRNRVQAADNWWGKQGPANNQIIGPVAFEPVLTAPVDLKVLP